MNNMIDPVCPWSDPVTNQTCLYTVGCTKYTVHCTVYSLHCTLLIAQSTLYTVQFSAYTVHCWLYRVHCKLLTVHCTVCRPSAIAFMYLKGCLWSDMLEMGNTIALNCALLFYNLSVVFYLIKLHFAAMSCIYHRYFANNMAFFLYYSMKNESGGTSTSWSRRQSTLGKIYPWLGGNI